MIKNKWIFLFCIFLIAACTLDSPESTYYSNDLGVVCGSVSYDSDSRTVKFNNVIVSALSIEKLSSLNTSFYLSTDQYDLNGDDIYLGGVSTAFLSGSEGTYKLSDNFCKFKIPFKIGGSFYGLIIVNLPYSMKDMNFNNNIWINNSAMNITAFYANPGIISASAGYDQTGKSLTFSNIIISNKGNQTAINFDICYILQGPKSEYLLGTNMISYLASYSSLTTNISFILSNIITNEELMPDIRVDYFTKIDDYTDDNYKKITNVKVIF